MKEKGEREIDKQRTKQIKGRRTMGNLVGLGAMEKNKREREEEKQG